MIDFQIYTSHPPSTNVSKFIPTNATIAAAPAPSPKVDTATIFAVKTAAPAQSANVNDTTSKSTASVQTVACAPSNLEHLFHDQDCFSLAFSTKKLYWDLFWSS